MQYNIHIITKKLQKKESVKFMKQWIALLLCLLLVLPLNVYRQISGIFQRHIRGSDHAIHRHDGIAALKGKFYFDPVILKRIIPPEPFTRSENHRAIGTGRDRSGTVLIGGIGLPVISGIFLQ